MFIASISCSELCHLIAGVTQPIRSANNKGDLENEAALFAIKDLPAYFPLLLTFKLTVADCVRLPLFPEIFKEKVPTLVFFVVEIVRIEFPDPVTEVGLNVAVAPDGKALTLSVTTP